MIVWKRFTFEAAHRLPNLPADHKCSRLHGHSFAFELHVEGDVDLTLGWVVDFGGLLRAAGDLIVQQLDHRYLNEIVGLDNPTSERLAEWIWEDAAVVIDRDGRFRLVEVRVQETCTAGVIYRPRA